MLSKSTQVSSPVYLMFFSVCVCHWKDFKGIPLLGNGVGYKASLGRDLKQGKREKWGHPFPLFGQVGRQGTDLLQTVEMYSDRNTC